MRAMAPVCIALVCSSCVTGDPRAGGIFWSEGKARQRQAALRQKLECEEHSTAAVKYRTDELRSQNASAQRALGNAREKLKSLDSGIASAQKEMSAAAKTDTALNSELARIERARVSLDAANEKTKVQLESEVQQLTTEVEQLRARNKALQSGL